MSAMPRFEKDWYFLGFVQDDERSKLEQLATKYKCALQQRHAQMGNKRAIYSNNPFRIDSIRKRLWDHRWAIHKNWVDENPKLKDFDPRKCKKIKKRLDK